MVVSVPEYVTVMLSCESMTASSNALGTWPVLQFAAICHDPEPGATQYTGRSGGVGDGVIVGVGVLVGRRVFVGVIVGLPDIGVGVGDGVEVGGGVAEGVSVFVEMGVGG